jgi:DNA-binding transcriptional LysR family regulator
MGGFPVLDVESALFCEKSGRPVLEKLEFLLALAREKHFGRAAEACGVTQPILSAGVKQLDFGVLLVNRGSRFQGFTAEGERVLEWARRIVGDTRAMRQEVLALKHGLAGKLRLAAIPTALAMVETLTTPFRARHPEVQFSVLSRTSIEILTHLENLEIDAGLTYLDNEPLGRVTAIPLYRERYRLLVAADAPLGDRQTVTWTEVAQVPLCLLTPDMQNRRIIERLLRDTGIDPHITLESDSMILLYSHVRTGRWASHAGAAGCVAWPYRCAALDSDHRPGSNSHDRLGGPGA